MKTIKIRFTVRYANEVGVLLYSLDMPIIMTWTTESITDDDLIYCICKLSNTNDKIPESLQLEKLKEKSFIKIY